MFQLIYVCHFKQTHILKHNGLTDGKTDNTEVIPMNQPVYTGDTKIKKMAELVPKIY